MFEFCPVIQTVVNLKENNKENNLKENKKGDNLKETKKGCNIKEEGKKIIGIRRHKRKMAIYDKNHTYNNKNYPCPIKGLQMENLPIFLIDVMRVLTKNICITKKSNHDFLNAKHYNIPYYKMKQYAIQHNEI